VWRPERRTGTGGDGGSGDRGRLGGKDGMLWEHDGGGSGL
jgi:hypothetical protein